MASLNRPPREFKTAADVHDERLTNRVLAMRCGPWADAEKRTGIVVLRGGRCWCWHCRVVGLIEEHRHEPIEAS
jgi:hypothetical protein